MLSSVGVQLPIGGIQVSRGYITQHVVGAYLPLILLFVEVFSYSCWQSVTSDHTLHPKQQ